IAGIDDPTAGTVGIAGSSGPVAGTGLTARHTRTVWSRQVSIVAVRHEPGSRQKSATAAAPSTAVVGAADSLAAVGAGVAGRKGPRVAATHAGDGASWPQGWGMATRTKTTRIT